MKIADSGVEKLTEIYFSDLPLSIRNNAICRAICRHIGASCVSMILYDGSSNELVCQGNYISPEKFQVTTDYAEIIKNIHFYEYITYEYGGRIAAEIKNPYTQYTNSNYILAAIDETERLTQESFEKLFNSLELNYPKYIAYNNVLLGQHYNISDNVESISGKYYQQLLNKQCHSDEPYILPYENINVPKLMLEGLVQLGVLEDEHFHSFVGLPLLADGRYFGIIRILFQSDPSLIERKSRLIPYARMASLFYGYHYQMDDFKKLNIHEHILNKDIEYMELSEVYRKIINCFGCIIRLYDEESEQNEIKGYTNSVAKYAAQIQKKDPFKYDHKQKEKISLDSIFKKGSTDYLVINAIKLSPTQPQHTTYYYYENDTEILRETKVWSELSEFDEPDIKNLYNEEHIGILRSFGIDEIVIIPIPNVEHSYVSFANTVSHMFTTKDIDFVIPLIHRLGLEISYEINKTQQSLIQSYIMYGRRLHHELSIPINAFSALVYQVQEKHPEIEQLNDIKFTYDYVNEILLQCETSTNYLSLLKEDLDEGAKARYRKKFERYDAEQYDLINDILKRYIQIFRCRSNTQAGINLYLHTKVAELKLSYNKNLLTCVLLNLLDNAIKYSYSDGQLKECLPTYDSDNPNSDGNIICEVLLVERNQAQIKIVNWGEPPPTDRDIFKMGNRGNDKTKGNGMGLFFVKAFVNDIFGGEITYTHSEEQKKTTFTVQIDI